MAFSGKGAVGGAAGGAAAGTQIMPGWGTAIGAVGGGLLGGFLSGGENKPYKPKQDNFGVPSYSRQYDNYGQAAAGFSHRGGPQMAGAQMGDSAFRGDQQALIRGLQADAAGRGPSQQLVRMQAQGAADRGMAQQMSIAAGGAPGSGAANARTAALAGGQMQSQVGGQAAMAGLQARLGATEQLGGALSGARGQDLARNQANMNAQLSAQQANMQSRLQQTGMNDQAQLEALRQRLALAGMQQQGGMNYEQLRAGGQNSTIGQPTTFDRMLGGLSGLGKMGMSSGSGPAAGSSVSNGGWTGGALFAPGAGQPGYAGQVSNY